MRATGLGFAALCLSPALAAAQPRGDWGSGYGPWHMWGWGMMGAGMGVAMILFWLVIIVLAIAAVRWLLAATPGRPAAPGETAEDILKKRYARGEIGKEEYEAKLRDLRN